MKEEIASMAMKHHRLQTLFLSVLLVYLIYALALVVAPVGLYSKGIAVFFAGGPVGMLLYHVWRKMRDIEHAAGQV